MFRNLSISDRFESVSAVNPWFWIQFKIARGVAGVRSATMYRTLDTCTTKLAVRNALSVTVILVTPFPVLRVRPLVSTAAIVGSADEYV